MLNRYVMYVTYEVHVVHAVYLMSCLCLLVCMYVCMYDKISKYICMYVCMCVYIYVLKTYAYMYPGMSACRTYPYGRANARDRSKDS